MFKRVVIWGHKYGTHEGGRTHSHGYVHGAFYNAFAYLNYSMLWLDDNSKIDHINFDNTLFLTEGQVCKNIPINKSSKYILHNCNGEQFKDIPLENKLIIQFFHKDVLSYNLEKINDYTYFGDRTLYQPWATNLLPHDIDLNNARNEIDNKECVWVGSYDKNDRTTFENNSQLDPFFDEAKKYGLNITMRNPWINPVSDYDNRKMINSAFVAPAINGWFQRDTFYIACRIFKNISYRSFRNC